MTKLKGYAIIRVPIFGFDVLERKQKLLTAFLIWDPHEKEQLALCASESDAMAVIRSITRRTS